MSNDVFGDLGTMSQGSQVISWIYSNIDTVTEVFIRQTYQQLVSDHWSTLTIFFAIYIAGNATLVYLGRTQETISDLIWKTLKLGFVISILTTYSIFDDFIYRFFVEAPMAINASILKALNTTIMGNTNGMASLSIFADKSIYLFTMLWQVSMAGKVFALIVLLAAGYLTVLASASLILAKIILAVLLAAAPILFIATLFKSTHGIFEGWLRQLFTFFLLPIFVTLLMSFTLAMIQIPTVGLENAVGDAVENNGEIELTAIVPFLLTVLIMFFVFKQIQSVASSIAGGIALPQYQSVTQKAGAQFGAELAQRWQRSGGVIGRAGRMRDRVKSRFTSDNE